MLSALVVRKGIITELDRVVDRPGASSINFTRRLDDTSSCTIQIPAWTRFTATEWEHEIEVIDSVNEVVWAGPVTTVTDGSDGNESEIGGRDLTAWFDHRFVYRSHNFVGRDLAEIFGRIALDALEPDDSPNIEVITHACGVVGDRSYTNGTFDIAGDKLRELARTGVDFTQVGRKLLIGGSVTTTQQYKLTNQMVEKVKRIRRGLTMANDVGVVGATFTIDNETFTILGRSIANESSIERMGLLQSRFDESDIKDEASANANAKTRRELIASDVGDVSVLLVEGQYSLGMLVPGTVWDCDISADRFMERSAGPVKGLRRLAQVDVTYDVNGMAAAIVLQPLGTTDEES